MTQEQITQNNKLIAEFMKVSTPNGLVFEDVNTGEIHTIKYHTSWDWLMPVVEKIEDLMDNIDAYEFSIGRHCVIVRAKNRSTGEKFYFSLDYFDYDFGSGERVKLYTVFKAVVEFINWYNENK